MFFYYNSIAARSNKFTFCKTGLVAKKVSITLCPIYSVIYMPLKYGGTFSFSLPATGVRI